MPIVWQMPDGSIRTTQLMEDFLAQEARPDETKAQTVLRLAVTDCQAQMPDLAGISPVLVRSADMPSTRVRRDAWRLSGSLVAVDPSIPLPPHPKQRLLDRMAAATTIDEVKAAIREIIRD